MSKQHLIGISMDRLTLRQRKVINYVLQNPDATLDEAAQATRQSFTYIRKWMVDKEFQDYWSDFRRWQLAVARERIEKTIATASRRLETESADLSPRNHARMIDELLRVAERLLGMEEAERDRPIRAFGWSETVEFPSRVQSRQTDEDAYPAGGERDVQADGLGLSGSPGRPVGAARRSQRSARPSDPQPAPDEESTQLTPEEFDDLIRARQAADSSYAP